MERRVVSANRTVSLDALAEKLSTAERALIQPILDARGDVLSDARVEMTVEMRVEQRSASCVCTVTPRERNCCPFQFVFDDPGEGRIAFWFFIGPAPGEEVFGGETVVSSDEIQFVARGVDEFLRSEVLRERWIPEAGRRVRQVLSPSLFPGEGPASPGTGCWGRPRRGGRLEAHTYEPWLT